MTVGAGDEHKAVIRISKVKGKGVHLYRSYTFQLSRYSDKLMFVPEKISKKKKELHGHKSHPSTRRYFDPSKYSAISCRFTFAYFCGLSLKTKLSSEQKKAQLKSVKVPPW